jgi:hypothetical protein
VDEALELPVSRSRLQQGARRENNGDVIIDFSAYWSDSRANRLEDHRVVGVKNSTRERLYLRGPEEIAKQVLWMLDRLGRDPRKLRLREQDGSDWTHRFEFDGPFPEEIAKTLALQKSALTLVAREPLHVGMALDFYSVPEVAWTQGSGRAPKWGASSTGGSTGAAPTL